MLATFSDVRLMSRFMNFVNSNLARELGRLYGWGEKFWSRRYRAIELSTIARARNRLKYLLAQGTKEALVARPADWPGFSSLRVLLLGELASGVWFNRSKEYRARKRNRAPPGGRTFAWQHLRGTSGGAPLLVSGIHCESYG